MKLFRLFMCCAAVFFGSLAIADNTAVRFNDLFLKAGAVGVLFGEAYDIPKPDYPRAAHRKKIAGTVALKIWVNHQGEVYSAEVISGPPALRQPSIDAALKSKFATSTRDGKPVVVAYLIQYTYAL